MKVSRNSDILKAIIALNTENYFGSEMLLPRLRKNSGKCKGGNLYGQVTRTEFKHFANRDVYTRPLRNLQY
jgi:hypothetical protein